MTLRFRKKISIFIVVILMILLVVPSVVRAQDPTDLDSRISELKSKISELQGREKSLNNQITILNSNIAITTIKIDSIKAAIARLEFEVNQLIDEIARLEQLLTRRSELVIHRIPESYKRNSVSQFGMLFLSRNFSDFLSRIKYVNRVQEQDAALLFQLKATQNNFNERKELREVKKVQQMELQRQLESESRELDRQKREKQALLIQTKNDEATYQQLLAQALAEKQALERALIEGVKVGPVNKGDPIALVGNTGYPSCSTGAHLHFEIRQNNSWVDPGGYLSSKSVFDDDAGGSVSLGSGGWDWPLSDPIRLTQHYGKTSYSWRYAYSGGMHTGYDMVSDSSEVIKAPEGGTLYSSSQTCGSSSIIKIKYIQHSDSVISFYLHVQ